MSLIVLFQLALLLVYLSRGREEFVPTRLVLSDIYLALSKSLWTSEPQGTRHESHSSRAELVLEKISLPRRSRNQTSLPSLSNASWHCSGQVLNCPLVFPPQLVSLAALTTVDPTQKNVRYLLKHFYFLSHSRYLSF